MRLVLVEGPFPEPLTAAEAKARLNIGDEISDEVMDAYITAARQAIDGADGWLGRALISQRWQYNLDEFPSCDGGKLYIPLPPLQEVTELSYLDSDGATVVMVEGDDYQVVMGPRPYIVPAYGTAWPSVTCRADAITVEFWAGYGDAGADVPEPIRTAIALGAGHLRSMSARNLSITEEVEEGVGSTRYVVSANAGEVISATQKALLSTYRVMVL
jgi:uncharacterized phiE125 gp8 family phage protein